MFYAGINFKNIYSAQKFVFPETTLSEVPG